MGKTTLFVLALFAVSTAHAQGTGSLTDPSGPGKAATIEGFWQDVAGRTLFKRDVSPSAVYGAWHSRDIGLPYFDTKQIRKSGSTYELVDLRYGDDHLIKVIAANEDSIEFVRSPSWSGCRMHHACRLNGDELFCSVENICRADGKDVLDSRGEERYARRSHCERIGREELMGIPTRCR
jgi:hypothetical protein